MPKKKTKKRKRTKSQLGKYKRTKGAVYERKLCNLFTPWWGKGEFARTPQSGGWAKARAFKVAKDIACSDKKFPFHIEAKNQENWVLDNIFLPDNKIWKWWEQAQEKCPKDKRPLLIFTRNNYPDYCLLYKSDFPDFSLIEAVALIYKDIAVVLLNDLFQLTNREYWLQKKKVKNARRAKTRTKTKRTTTATAVSRPKQDLF